MKFFIRGSIAPEGDFGLRWFKIWNKQLTARNGKSGLGYWGNQWRCDAAAQHSSQACVAWTAWLRQDGSGPRRD
eukprot:6179872-Pleurochrysis_carterae.AAC.3